MKSNKQKTSEIKKNGNRKSHQNISGDCFSGVQSGVIFSCLIFYIFQDLIIVYLLCLFLKKKK